MAWILLCGCQAFEKAPSSSSLTYAAVDTIHGFNPLIRDIGWNEANSLIYNTLYRIDHRGTLTADLAESIDVRNGGIEHHIHLREDVFWHDGIPFTAEDVRVTFECIRDPDYPSHKPRLFEEIEELRVVGPRELCVVLQKPRREILSPLTDIAILPAHRPETADPPTEATSRNLQDFPLPIGTGPFRVVGATEEGALEFVAVERYHLGRPNLQSMSLIVVPDELERWRLLRQGAVDIAPVPPNTEAGSEDALSVSTIQTATLFALALNLSSDAFEDPRHRRALLHSIDAEAIIDQVFEGDAQPAIRLWVGDEELCDDDLFRVDPQKAREILDDPLTESAETLSLNFVVCSDRGAPRRCSELLRGQLLEGGFAARRHILPSSETRTLRDLFTRGFDMVAVRWQFPIDPGGQLRQFFHSEGDLNAGGYADPVLDSLIERFEGTQDPLERDSAREEILVRVREAVPFIPLASPVLTIGTRKDLKNVKVEISQTPRTLTRYAHRWRF